MLAAVRVCCKPICNYFPIARSLLDNTALTDMDTVAALAVEALHMLGVALHANGCRFMAKVNNTY